MSKSDRGLVNQWIDNGMINKFNLDDKMTIVERKRI